MRTLGAEESELPIIVVLTSLGLLAQTFLYSLLDRFRSTCDVG
jgi:hypothetical protein